jgi:hypothetical protein
MPSIAPTKYDSEAEIHDVESKDKNSRANIRRLDACRTQIRGAEKSSEDGASIANGEAKKVKDGVEMFV